MVATFKAASPAAEPLAVAHRQGERALQVADCHPLAIGRREGEAVFARHAGDFGIDWVI